MRDMRLIPGDVLIATKIFKYFEKEYRIGDVFDYPVSDHEAKRLIRARRIRVGDKSEITSKEVKKLVKEMKQVVEASNKAIEEFSLSKGAKNLVDEFGLTEDDLSLIDGSGRDGQIIKSDVEAYVSSKEEDE